MAILLLFAGALPPRYCGAQSSSPATATPNDGMFDFESLLKLDLDAEFSGEGYSKADDNTFTMPPASLLKWQAKKSPQLRIEFKVDWPKLRIETPTELDLIMLPQGMDELGLSSLGAGKPCGISIRSIRSEGEFAWEILHRAFTPDGAPLKVKRKRVVPASGESSRLRIAYNYGVVTLWIDDGPPLDAYFDNFCAGIKEIQFRVHGQSAVLSNLQGKRSAPSPLPSFFQRLRLIRAAAWDHQAAELQSENRFAEALKLQRNIHSLCREILGLQHIYTIRSGRRLVWLLAATSDNDSADDLIGELVDAALRHYGPEHSEVASLFNEHALLYASREDWESADGMWAKAHRIHDPLGLRTPEEYIKDFAQDLRQFGRRQFAVLVRKHAIKRFRDKYPEDHWRVTEAKSLLASDQRRLELTKAEQTELRTAKTLQNQADKQMTRGEFPSALKLAEQVLEIRTRILGEDDAKTALAHTYMGLILKKLGRPKLALQHYETDVDITRRTQGSRHREYAAVINNLARLIQDEDRPRCEKLLLEALDIRQEHRLRYPNDYAEGLSNLGRFYCFSLAQFDKGLPLLEKSYQVRLNHNASDSVEVSRSLSNLGHCYRHIGDNRRAVEFYERSIAIKMKHFGAKHIDVAILLTAEGSALAALGKTKEAIERLQTAKQIIVELGGKSNAYYPKTINYLAAALADDGQNKAARELYVESLQLRRQQVGPNHLHCGQIQLNLARNSFEAKQYAEALKECREATRIMSAAVGDDSLSAEAGYDLEVSILFAMNTELDRAYELNTRLLKGKQLKLQKLIAALSETEQIAQIRALRRQLFKQLELGKLLDAAPLEIYRSVISWKGVIASRALADRLADSEQSVAAREELRDVRARLAEYVFASRHASETEYLQGLRALEREKERLQRLIASTSEQGDSGDPIDLLPHLPANGMLLDFLRVITPTQEARYHVFALTPAKSKLQVHWIDLGPADPIETLVSAWRKSIMMGKEDRTVARQLRDRIWSPIIDQVEFQGNGVYVCPDGALTALPWCALPGQRPDSYLLEDVTVATLPFAQYLSLSPTKDASSAETASGTATAEQQVLLVGNLDYKPTIGAAPNDGKAAAPQFALRAQRASIDSTIQWSPLPATATETAAIARLAQERSITRLEKKAATLSTTVSALRQANCAHFASHGFFAAPTRKTETANAQNKLVWGNTLSRNPFLLSGIVLSGASDGTNRAPALLSAEAIASLPLDDLELVTLSACETGLGHVAGGEGVYGLQRSFHLAGAQHVVASLWKVEDAATAALMELFYNYHWKHKLAPAEAMRRAQLDLLQNPSIVTNEKVRSATMLRGLGGSSVKVNGGKSRPQDKRTSARRWAAFTVSGRLATSP